MRSSPPALLTQLVEAVDALFRPVLTAPGQSVPAAALAVAAVRTASAEGSLCADAFKAWVGSRILAQGRSVFWAERLASFRLGRFVLQCGLTAGAAAGAGEDSAAETGVDVALRHVLQVRGEEEEEGEKGSRPPRERSPPSCQIYEASVASVTGEARLGDLLAPCAIAEAAVSTAAAAGWAPSVRAAEACVLACAAFAPMAAACREAAEEAAAAPTTAVDLLWGTKQARRDAARASYGRVRAIGQVPLVVRAFFARPGVPLPAASAEQLARAVAGTAGDVVARLIIDEKTAAAAGSAAQALLPAGVPVAVQFLRAVIDALLQPSGGGGGSAAAGQGALSLGAFAAFCRTLPMFPSPVPAETKSRARLMAALKNALPDVGLADVVDRATRLVEQVSAADLSE